MIKKIFVTVYFLLIAYHLPLTTEVWGGEIVWEMKETGVDFLRYGIGGRARKKV